MNNSVGASARDAVGADGGGAPPAAGAAAAAAAAEGSLADTAAASADEVIAVLSARNFGKMSAAEKKGLLKLVVQKKEEVIAKASSACGALMADTLRTIIPEKDKTVVAAAYNNKSVATLMFHLHSFFRSVRLVPSSSIAASAAPSTAPTTWRQAMARIVELVDQATAVANQDKEDKTNAQWYSLSGSQLLRRFGARGTVPADALLRFCISCHHEYVDEPDENAAMVVRNEEKKTKHLENVQGFEDARAAKRDYISTATNKPRDTNKYERPFRQCHCQQFACTTSAGHVPRTECPIQCIDPATKARYPVNQGVCTCPLCSCQCAKAWEVRQMGQSYCLYCCSNHTCTHLTPASLFSCLCCTCTCRLERNSS